eukprot:gnl/Trimastix_PCT/3019.p1 GENE.gnl/Trimastix_PCT/3019~~gnl/Trimastix_PCT/3019.p1  ORF type:complete len:362 (+),score=20.70 gnl/Trimastix_PCT/3019:79-1164(+)
MRALLLLGLLFSLAYCTPEIPSNYKCNHSAYHIKIPAVFGHFPPCINVPKGASATIQVDVHPMVAFFRVLLLDKENVRKFAETGSTECENPDCSVEHKGHFESTYTLTHDDDYTLLIQNRGSFENLFDVHFLIQQTQTPAVIEIQSPKAGDRWEQNSQHQIRWLTHGQISQVAAIVLRGGECHQGEVIAMDVPNLGKYDWKVPKECGVGKNFVIELFLRLPFQFNMTRFTSAPFTLVAPSGRPFVQSVNPPCGSEVGCNLPSVSIEFSRDMDQTTYGNVVFQNTYSGKPVSIESRVVGAKSLKMNLAEALEGRSSYQIIAPDTVTDLQGTPLIPFKSHFQTHACTSNRITSSDAVDSFDMI